MGVWTQPITEYPVALPAITCRFESCLAQKDKLASDATEVDIWLVPSVIVNTQSFRGTS